MITLKLPKLLRETVENVRIQFIALHPAQPDWLVRALNLRLRKTVGRVVGQTELLTDQGRVLLRPTLKWRTCTSNHQFNNIKFAFLQNLLLFF